MLVDSETVWDEARRHVVAGAGGTWRPDATRAMMGMSSPEWAAYLRDELGVGRDAEAIIGDVVALVARHYQASLPLLPHAVETVTDLAARWALGLASSSNRPIIEMFLDASGLRDCFAVTVSSEEVRRGKPARDVYLEAGRRLDTAPERCVAIEDSTNGIRAAVAAGMAVVAVPNPHFPPERAALDAATAVVTSLRDVTVDLIEALP